MIPAGLAVAFLPTPSNARDKLLGMDNSGGSSWSIWKFAVFAAFLLGGGGGLVLSGLLSS